MSIIVLPDNNFRSVDWTLVQPTQVNRSEFTSARQVMQLPGASYWKASAEHVPLIGEANIRAWRSFFAKLNGQANTFLLPATEGQQSARYFYHLEPDAPIDSGTGVTISADARDVTRTLAGHDWGTAYAYYGGTVSGGCRLSFRPEANTVTFMAGLNSDVSGATGYTALDYAFHCWGTGVLQVYEAGILIASYGAYQSSDILSVIYDDAAGNVTYYRNGEALRTVSAAGGLALRADMQIYDVGASIKDISFGELATATAGATSVDLSGPAGSQEQAVTEGWYATALFEGGGSQLVTITGDAAADGSGDLAVNFLPMLRGKPFAFLTGRPFCRVAMDSPELGYSVDPGAVYGFGLTATEAF